MKKYSFLMKFSLLSISLYLISASSVAATIPLIAAEHPDVPLAVIEFLTNAPSLAVMFFVLLSVPISNRIGAKNCTILGLTICLISGVMPVFLDNLWLILFSRIMLGVGAGLYNSLAISMIQIFFKGKEATKLIGIRSGFEGLGGALLTLLAGFLIQFGWHQTYWVYATILPSLILFTLFVPKVPEQKDQGSQKVFNRKIIPYVLILLVMIVFYNCLSLKLPSLIVSEGLGDAAESSFIFSMAQLIFVVCGFAFGKIYGWTKNWIRPIGVLLMAGGYVFIAFADSLWMLLIGSLMAGASFALVTPWLFNQAGNIGIPESIPLSNSLLIMGAQIGGISAPFILMFLQDVPFLSQPFAQCFLSCSVGLIILAIIGSFFVRTIKESA